VTDFWGNPIATLTNFGAKGLASWVRTSFGDACWPPMGCFSSSLGVVGEIAVLVPTPDNGEFTRNR
jgi:hypothetical protein